MTSHHFASL